MRSTSGAGEDSLDGPGELGTLKSTVAHAGAFGLKVGSNSVSMTVGVSRELSASPDAPMKMRTQKEKRDLIRRLYAKKRNRTKITLANTTRPLPIAAIPE